MCRKAAHEPCGWIVRQGIKAGGGEGWAGQRQGNGLEGKCDFPQVMKSNCCHFLGSNFGSGKPGGEKSGMGSRKSRKKEPLLERRPLSTLNNRFALATVTRITWITLEQRGRDHHCHRRQHLQHASTYAYFFGILLSYNKNNMNMNLTYAISYVTAYLAEGKILGA